MILLVDNYDSFTFNLFQAVAALGPEVRVVRNDAAPVDELLASEPSAVILSPGPGRPGEAGCVPDLLAALPPSMPLLGVCLGHQALVEHCGGVLRVDAAPVHGKRSAVHHDGRGLFTDLPNPLQVGRYHSLVADRAELPEELELSAWTEGGRVMAVRHRTRPWVGLQFHPESILSPQGSRLLAAFLHTTREAVFSS